MIYEDYGYFFLQLKLEVLKDVSLDWVHVEIRYVVVQEFVVKHVVNLSVKQNTLMSEPSQVVLELLAQDYVLAHMIVNFVVSYMEY